MSTKLKGSLYIDDDIKLIYKNSMYKIFVDDHCTKYEIYDSGNSVTGYIRLFILNGSIKDYMPWFVQLIVVYVYFIVILYIVNTIKG